MRIIRRSFHITGSAAPQSVANRSLSLPVRWRHAGAGLTAERTRGYRVAGSVFRTKSIDTLLAESRSTGEGTLKRTLGPGALVALGIGAIIGAGLFVRTAAAIADRAGPSVALAFIVAGVGCAFAGLCYAEFASMIPVAGSAYTYSYATMGEFVAWIIGWDLVLEYAVGAATVAIAWSEYLNKVLEWFGLALPYQWSTRRSRCRMPTGRSRHHEHPGGVILGAADGAADPRHQGIGAASTASSSSSRSRSSLLVIAHRLGLHQPGESHAVHSRGDDLHHAGRAITHNYGGIMGILGAAGVVFFAFIGFDAVSTAAQEAKNPKRDMPIGILGSLVVCTVLYVLFSYVLSGVATVEDFRTQRPRSLGGVRHLELHARLRVAVASGDGGDPRRLLVGDPGDAARPVARLLFDEPRRPGAEGLLGGASDLPDAVQVEHAVLRVHGALRRVRSRRHRRRDDQHRDAVRVHARLRRRVDHARAPAGPRARLHGAGAAGGGRCSASWSAAR